jgi:hypothetical protein
MLLYVKHVYFLVFDVVYDEWNAWHLASEYLRPSSETILVRLSGQRPRRSGREDSSHYWRNLLEDIYTDSLNGVPGRIRGKA